MIFNTVKFWLFNVRNHEVQLEKTQIAIMAITEIILTVGYRLFNLEKKQLERSIIVCYEV